MIEFPLALLITSILGALLAGFACSTMGVFVVRMNLSSIGYLMSHAAFAGAAFGLMIETDPMIGAIIFSFATALILGPLAEKARLQSNIVIGFLFSFMIALAFIFLNYVPGQATSARALRILWGSIFSVTYNDIFLLTLLSFILVIFIVVFYKELLSIMFNRKLAESSGVNTKLFYFTVLFLTGFAVSLSLRIVGGLLVFALIINPTSTAYQFFYDFKKILIFSPFIGIISCLVGFWLSVISDFPIGASIVIISALFFASAIVVSPKRRKGNGKKNKTNARTTTV
jgi:ABC-type Mn2+/Zn2+ transport system permease subunit